MASVHLYFPGDRLSGAELAAACLDGHVVSLGEAYIPADAAETAALRAGSLAPLVGEDLAATHLSAAWIHGATASPPARHRVQRVGTRRVRPVIDRRLEFHDTQVSDEDIMRLGGIWTTTPTRTLADLARVGTGPELAGARALVRIGVATPAEALDLLVATGRLPGKRAATTLLRAWSEIQLDVTR